MDSIAVLSHDSNACHGETSAQRLCARNYGTYKISFLLFPPCHFLEEKRYQLGRGNTIQYNASLSNQTAFASCIEILANLFPLVLLHGGIPSEFMFV
jgi:hypothetical protein